MRKQSSHGSLAYERGADNRVLEIHLGAFLMPGMTFYHILLNETEQSSAGPFRQLNYHQNKGPYKAEC